MKTVVYLCQLTIIGLISLNFVACGDGRKDIRDYYFPLRKLTQGMVYEYQVLGNEELVPDIWYYRALVSDTSMYLVATAYDENLLPAQLSRLELVSNGIRSLDLKLYSQDSTSNTAITTQAEVMAGAVFPFKVKKDEGLYLYQIRYELPDDPGPTTLILNRQYAGETTFDWQGQRYPAIRFRLNAKAEIEDDRAGGIDPSFQGEEIYAKNIGLVYYSRIFGQDTLAYRLADQYSMSELEQRFGAMQ